TGLLARTATGAAAATRTLLPYAAAWVGATVAISAASNATEKWRTSTDSLKGFLASEAHFMQNILTFHPIKAFQDLIGESSAQRDARAAQEYAQGQIDSYALRGQRSGFAGIFDQKQTLPFAPHTDMSWVPAAREQVA